MLVWCRGPPGCADRAAPGTLTESPAVRGTGRVRMDPGSSVTTWIGQVGGGDHEAASRLWGRYFAGMIRTATAKLRDVPLAPADGEDVALSAFHSFCQALAGNKLPHVRDRDELWRTLVLMVAGKAVDLRRRHGSLKRGGGLPAADPDELAAVTGREPDPAFAAQLNEELDLLLARLPDAEVRRMALLKLHGHTAEEIARVLGCSLRTVSRRLTLIRRTWEETTRGAP